MNDALFKTYMTLYVHCDSDVSRIQEKPQQKQTTNIIIKHL